MREAICLLFGFGLGVAAAAYRLISAGMSAGNARELGCVAPMRGDAKILRTARAMLAEGEPFDRVYLANRLMCNGELDDVGGITRVIQVYGGVDWVTRVEGRK